MKSVSWTCVVLVLAAFAMAGAFRTAGAWGDPPCVVEANACGCQLNCAPFSTDMGIRRSPVSGKGFPQSEMYNYVEDPPLGPIGRVLLNRSQFLATAAASLTAWHSLNDSIPKDGIEYQNGNICFAIEWRTVLELGSLARTRPIHGLEFCGAGSNCRICRVSMWLSSDPLDEYAGNTFWAGCAPNCGGNFDLRSLLTHEFGHALGLAHVKGDVDATMWTDSANPAGLATRLRSDQIWTPTACEGTLLGQIYRDNFTPSRLRHFTTEEASLGGLALTWVMDDESTCESFRVARVANDGAVVDIASSMGCAGSGVEYSVVDQSPPSAGAQYFLLIKEDGGVTGSQETVIASANHLDVGFGASLATARRASSGGGGSEDVIALLNAFSAAVSSGSDAAVKELLAPGFRYQLSSSEWWGRTVELATARASRRCFAGSGVAPDSLFISPGAAETVAEGLVKVLGSVAYYRLTLPQLIGASMWPECQLDNASAEFQVEIMVENVGTGWKMRSIREL